MEKRREYTSSELGTINTNIIATTNGKTLHCTTSFNINNLKWSVLQLEVAVKNGLGRLSIKCGKKVGFYCTSSENIQTLVKKDELTLAK